MAFKDSQVCVTLPASGNLSSKQFYVVEVDSNGRAAVQTTAGSDFAGILQNDPAAAGRAAEVAISGIAKAQAGATAITRGAAVMNSTTGVVVAASTGSLALGYSLETVSTGVSPIISVLIQPHRRA